MQLLSGADLGRATTALLTDFEENNSHYLQMGFEESSVHYVQTDFVENDTHSLQILRENGE